EKMLRLELRRDQPLANNRARALRLGDTIPPDHRQRRRGAIAGTIRRADLVILRRRPTGRAADADAIVAEIVDAQCEKRYRAIGAEIIRRIAQLVEQLLLDDHLADRAAGA